MGRQICSLDDVAVANTRADVQARHVWLCRCSANVETDHCGRSSKTALGSADATPVPQIHGDMQVQLARTLSQAVIVLGTLAAASTWPAAAVDISGAGATFPYPIYAKWADAYKKETGVGLNYQ